MKCFVCRFGEIEPGTTTLNLNLKSLTLVVKEVPAEVCDACGEGYLDPSVSERLDEIVNEAEKSGVEVLILKYAPAKISSEQVNGVKRQPVEEFINRLGLTPEQYSTKEYANGYRLYVNTQKKRQPRFGYVRLNRTREHAGMMAVYAIGDFRDPENRFQSQPKNPKDCVYWFSPQDEDAMEYAVRVVKSAYESRS
jgi:YgiT-type zinc finger domain-containing protein